MLPHYNPNRNPQTRWERFMDWLEDKSLLFENPLFIFFCIMVAVWLFIMTLMPRCPKCDIIVHPMDVYCPHCGKQLRIE